MRNNIRILYQRDGRKCVVFVRDREMPTIVTEMARTNCKVLNISKVG